MLFARLMNRGGAVYDERADAETFNRLNVWGAGGLVIYVLTITFAGIQRQYGRLPRETLDLLARQAQEFYNALDELTQAGSTNYTYDQNGNEKTAGASTLTYDLPNKTWSLTGTRLTSS